MKNWYKIEANSLILSIKFIDQASLYIKSHISNHFQLHWGEGHGIQCNDTQNNGTLYGLVTKDQSAKKSKRQKVTIRSREY